MLLPPCYQTIYDKTGVDNSFSRLDMKKIKTKTKQKSYTCLRMVSRSRTNNETRDNMFYGPNVNIVGSVSLVSQAKPLLKRLKQKTAITGNR